MFVDNNGDTNMAQEMVRDNKDPHQINKIINQLMEEGRISGEEHAVMMDALKRASDYSMDLMILDV